MHPIRAGFVDTFAGDHRGIEISAGTNNGSFYLIHRAKAGNDSRYLSIFHTNIRDHGLLQIQILLLFQNALHILLILAAICLSAQRMNCRTFSPVEHPVLDAAAVSRFRHLSAKGIQLSDKVAFACAADGRIAGHIAHGIQIDGKHHGFQPHACSSQRSFNSGVSCTDDGNIILSSKIFHNQTSLCGIILSGSENFFKRATVFERLRHKILLQ